MTNPLATTSADSSSTVLSETDDPHSTSKRVRMTLACERCRTKKVKCDFVHPTCGRCRGAKAMCSYTGAPTQIDLFNLVQLNDAVTRLHDRIASIENGITQVQNDTSYIAGKMRHSAWTGTTVTAAVDEHSHHHHHHPHSRKKRKWSPGDQSSLAPITPTTATAPVSTTNTVTPHDLVPASKANWTLSLTPTGLRIDTNIISLNDLYDILLNGLSQLQLTNTWRAYTEDTNQTHNGSNESSSSSSSNAPYSGATPASTPTDTDASAASTPHSVTTADILSTGDNAARIPKRPRSLRRTPSASVASAEDAVIVKHNPLYRSKDVIFPLYSAWESNSSSSSPTARPKAAQQQQKQQTQKQQLQIRRSCGQQKEQGRWQEKDIEKVAIDAELLEQLLHIYEECFLCLPLPDMDAFIHDCKTQTGSPLLFNAMLAWSARHAAIYHRGTFPSEQDPNRVGEPYFIAAKTLLKDQFLTPTLTTVHALLLMYIYSIGKTGQDRDESEAYTFLGLATRMSVDMGLYQEPYDGNDEVEKEMKRRLFAAAEFLETLCASHSEKPLMFPLEGAITVQAPRVLDTETNLERRYRTEFTVYRHKINQIYRKIHTSVSGKADPYLATVSNLEKQLKEWYASLPAYFQITSPQQRKTRSWASTSFREQACLKLNFEYHFQMCQLYSIFLPPHPDETHQATTSAIAFLSLRLCLENADAITDLLKCWAQLKQPWCHFTLDTLVMACLVYSHQLLSAKEDVLAHAKRQMGRIAHVLTRSPVKHHKYVKTLVSRIERQIRGEHVEEAPLSPDRRPTTNDTNPMTSSSLEEERQLQTEPLSLPPPPTPPVDQQQQATTSLWSVAETNSPSILPSQAHPGATGFATTAAAAAAAAAQQQQQQQSPEYDWSWLKPVDWNYAELDMFRFADFVYTPAMDTDSSNTVGNNERYFQSSMMDWPV